ncbi:solute-binding protein [Roseomonas frigidaquae]|uniref:Solute-binding protein n=1 Tax=Falsiroseomonas frigidaquae TaxID=487318 RepID=A0ABX1F1X4_9PROT|nr:substrate-binding domain-containing protein [Falsiroseomonas frigidaquae]NKE46319.1 solute-binding protein [Falsiroseomonas frigidaquae]
MSHMAAVLCSKAQQACATTLSIARVAAAQKTAPIRVFGPGGPAPAMRAAAEAFRAAQRVPVEVIAGPTPGWAGRVAREADLVFSGAEYMKDDFMAQFRDLLEAATRTTLFVRPAALLVRVGNPRTITGLRDLLSRPPGQACILATGAVEHAHEEPTARSATRQPVCQREFRRLGRVEHPAQPTVRRQRHGAISRRQVSQPVEAEIRHEGCGGGGGGDRDQPFNADLGRRLPEGRGPSVRHAGQEALEPRRRRPMPVDHHIAV